MTTSHMATSSATATCCQRSSRVSEHFRAAGGDPHLLDPVLGVDPEYLQAALDEMKQRFGATDGYFTQGLGIDEAEQQALRDALTESG